jgi:hypothetical protein
MPSQFTWGQYFDDNGGIWAVRVNSTYFGHVERGWTFEDDPNRPPMPRQWLPRRVVGIDEFGHGQTAVSPSTDSLIWSGQSSSFSILGNDGSIILCTVIGRLEENTSKRPPGTSP